MVRICETHVIGLRKSLAKCTNCQRVGLRDINTESSPPTCPSIDDQVRGKLVESESLFILSRVNHRPPYKAIQVMASCGYSTFVDGTCGSSAAGVVKCIAIESCGKDIKEHLKTYDVRDTSLQNEAQLLLARAGNQLNEGSYAIITNL